MDLFKKTPDLDFLGQRYRALVLSGIVFLLSIVSLGVYGLHWGLDLTGGTQLQIHFSEPLSLEEVRQRLKTQGVEGAVVVSFGTASDVLITLPLVSELPSEEEGADAVGSGVIRQVLDVLPEATLLRTDYVGPQVGKELATSGMLAVLITVLAIMIYINLRFEWRFAVGAIVALVHDPLIILGVFSFWQIPFDLIILASILAVIGYSINDTIVIFDRVRENFRKSRQGTSVVAIFNQSINQTLARTLMTSGSTLLAILPMFFWGGNVLHNFAVPLIIGIVVGTYSSIFIASPVAVLLGLERQHLMPGHKKQHEDDRP